MGLCAVCSKYCKYLTSLDHLFFVFLNGTAGFNLRSQETHRRPLVGRYIKIYLRDH